MPQTRRRSLIMKMLKNGPVWSQEDLAEALAQAGEPVTQTTISRDLAAIGALRGPDGYRLGESLNEAVGVEGRQEELARVLRRQVMSAVKAHALVVVRTAPGHAQMVAIALDRYPMKGVEGTVAGDDTIFLATPAPKVADRVCREINQFIIGNQT